MRSLEIKSYNSVPEIYIDIDGTLADYFGELERHHSVDHWKDIGKNDVKIEQIASKPGFFENLKLLPNAKKLISGVLRYTDHYNILSCPLMTHVDQSTEEKNDWVEKNLKSHLPKNIVFSENKFKWATKKDGTPNVLIDDYEPNIKLWNAHGGIALLYADSKENTNVNNVLEKVRKVFLGKISTKKIANEIDEDKFSGNNSKVKSIDGKLYTSNAVQEYVDRVHHDYHLNSPFKKHRAWILVNMPLGKLHTNEHIHQSDPYYRRININFDHIDKNVTHEKINAKPIISDANGFILDGNHRVNAAKMFGYNTIQCFIPYNHNF